MRTIMIATDFSERSDRALRRAALLARATGAQVHLVHVVDDDRPRRIVEHETGDARRLLHDLGHSLRSHDGIGCRTSVVLADPFAGIARAASEAGADLLVIGPHRRHLLRDAFAGTTAERVIRTASCPVLMANGPPVGPWRHLLLTTDLSEASHAALRRFADLKIGAGAARTVLHVFDAPALRLAMAGTLPEDARGAYLADQRAEAMGRLTGFLASAGLSDADPIVRRSGSPPAHEILAAAGEVGADLLVLSSVGKGRLARAILGSVAAQVLASAAVDVLVVPPPDRDGP
ncbi:universal stress protein [Cereibacter azotoformans]|uniref:universal stress protein n=1 Tax=Cereibacter azotoformans TaxID=43057 RepID=UPI000C6E8DA1|nr:universal stress protein [Cereibacter azotoformans]